MMIRAILTVTLAMVVAGAVTAGEQDVVIPYEDGPSVATGAALYGENCAACHGESREGETNWRARDADGYLPAPPHDEHGHTWHHSDAQLFVTVKYGTEKLVGGGYRSRMAGYEGVLSDEEILQVLAYIKAQWPAPVIGMHNRINEDAKAAAN